jgi:hypothetical protein
MAVDSARKRSSTIGLPFPPSVGIYLPESGAGQAWRQTVGYGYYGILVGGAAAVEVLDFERKFRGVGRGAYRGLT